MIEEFIINELINELRNRGLSLALAESCTGGLFAASITRLAGVSDVFLGGIIPYSNSIKERLLGLSQQCLSENSAVSNEAVQQMLKGTLKQFQSDCAVALTGIAGPSGGSLEKPIGTVWISVGGPSFEVVEKKLFKGDRQSIQKQSVEESIHMLLNQLRCL